MADRRYLLDANVLITAARQYYAFDFAPRFWECLEEYAKTGRVLSIDRVKEELLRGQDDLADWAKGAFADAFAATSEPEVLAAFGQIMTWAQSQDQFMEAAKAEFAGCADGWLVAYAKVNDLVVVTHEVYSADARKRVLIPNVCRAFGVEYVDTWAMLRGLGAGWGRKRPNDGSAGELDLGKCAGAVGHMIAALLPGLAEIELEFRAERQAAGIAVAKKRGVYRGRVRGTTKAKPQRVVELWNKGFKGGEIAEALGVSERTVWRHLKAVA